MGLFEFQSDARLGSKANAHDARIKMLELYGNDALGWQIEKVERKASAATKGISDGQMELDFREPVQKPGKARKRSTKRGVL